MAKRGNRLFVCGECGSREYVHWTASVRAKRITCTACGSARMEMVSEAGQKERAQRLDIAAGGGTASAPRQLRFNRS